MGKIAACSLAVFSTMFSAPSFAACNMGEDAKNITQLNFGKLKLSGMSPGDLRVTGQHALPDKDSWPFVLRVKNNQIDLSVSGASTSSSAPLKFDATMQMTKPITGFILERITPSGCNREIRIQDGDLNGNTIRFKNGTLSNSFGGTVPLAGLEWKVQRQEDVSDLRGRASGKLRLAGPKIKVVGAQVRLPGQGKFPAGHFKFLRVWSVKFLHPRGRTRDC